ncbi:glycosyltransferase [Clostridium saccharoperbutylacetonicum]|uniref:glycosyltransferase n=1 Tax=Clostridium saccharoperbutylacetonicum TaxID=36745 RepID=UPI000983D4F1|nr:glycosyltransferase [Clostridium saccharoperbutylacetonicum]AQR97827.1 undecaprenyl-phosphate 4-deoxy-4-formamido-L-arabinose transferase [Clostridium saccharoperbutylacetonicum]NSB33719.1 glycosyltransferase involved in cell wall biosynthesis [Clostridium saccharoperbutylacetonicum]
MKINILFPVLNEERRLERGIIQTIDFMDEHFKENYKISIIDNGSIDNTEAISKKLESSYHNVKYVKLKEKGVGLALREGIKLNNCEIVGYMDIDLSTKLDHLIEMKETFEKYSDIKIVNGSRLSKNSVVIGRKFSREVTSRGLKYILKIVLGMRINDALCGFKFFRKETIEDLMKISSDTNGWFYCAEILLRAEKNNIKIKEIPVVWQDDYDTTVNVKKLIKEYLKEISRLFFELRIKK